MNIVLITDNISNQNINNTRRDLEGNTEEQNERMKKSIVPLCDNLIHYTSIDEFETNIKKHKTDIILPLLYGDNGFNQKTILPSLCELHKLSYVGADPFTHTLCNDKYLSKIYAEQFGIKSANSILIRKKIENKIDVIKTLKLPLIVKPNYGGGSVGITKNNLVYDYSDAQKVVDMLLTSQNIPILIEEYIPGNEVELIILGNSNKIKLCHEVQLVMDNKTNFTNEIWSLETKKIDDTNIDFKSSNLISENDKNSLINLFQSFNKIEFVRMDGRIYNGVFYLIEISPDCYLGDDCAFYFAFKENRFSHTEMFNMIIHNHLD